MINLLLLGVSCLVSALTIEIALRIFMPHEDIAEWYQPHQKYHHTLKPDFYQRFHYRKHDAVMTVQTDAAGFRACNSDSTTDKGMKVLFLGDSFVFGYGLEVHDRLDCFLRRLAEKRNLPVDTVNWGVPGWGTRHQVRYAADHLQEESPDVLVLVFCKNDPANDRGLELPTLPDMESPLYPVKTWLRSYSHSYRWLLEIRARSWQRGSQGDAPAQPHMISPEEWDNTGAYILRLAAILESVNPQACLLLMASAPEDKQVRSTLEQLSEKSGHLFYIDLLPYISDIPKRDRVMPWDGHWSAAVHKAAARAVLEWIEEVALAAE